MVSAVAEEKDEHSNREIKDSRVGEGNQFLKRCGLVYEKKNDHCRKGADAENLRCRVHLREKAGDEMYQVFIDTYWTGVTTTTIEPVEG